MTSSDKAFTGSMPQLYDRLLVPIILAPYARTLSQRVATGRPRDVLEIAAGTGALTQELAAALPAAARITATDLNALMLDQARTRLANDPRLTWQQADALALPFDDASFDAVVCQFGAMFFPDKIKGYAEARRVLRPEGHFVLSVWDRIETNHFTLVVHEALRQVFPESPPQFLARTPHGYHDVRRIRGELTMAGFTEVSIDTVTLRSEASSPRDPAIALCQGTPMRGEIEARGPPGLEAATEAAAEALSRRFGDGPIEGWIQALVISAA